MINKTQKLQAIGHHRNTGDIWALRNIYGIARWQQSEAQRLHGAKIVVKQGHCPVTHTADLTQRIADWGAVAEAAREAIQAIEGERTEVTT